ncbi:MAG: efflux RND transporter periplasmic adaptor subunit [Flavobacteriales bacterium]
MKIHTMKYFIYSLSILVAATIASCGGGGTGNATLDALTAKRDSLKTQQLELAKQLAEVEKLITALDTGIKAPLVSIMNIQRKPFDSYFAVQGEVATDNQAMIFPNPIGQGTIKKIYVREGERVSAGQKLVQIDEGSFTQSMAALETQRDAARDTYNRLKKLWDQKIGTESQLVAAKATLDGSEEGLKKAKELLAQFTITAPISGTVDRIYSKEGEMAGLASPTPILTIVNLGNMYMRAAVSENYLSMVRNGGAVQVLLPNFDTIPGTIARIGNTINSANRTFEVTVNLPGGNDVLKPNLIGAVRINDYHVDSTIVLPASLIMRDAQDRPFVFVEENMKAKKVILQTGRSYDGQTEILDGLTGMERIVSKGARKLVDGQELRIENL